MTFVNAISGKKYKEVANISNGDCQYTKKFVLSITDEDVLESGGTVEYVRWGDCDVFEEGYSGFGDWKESAKRFISKVLFEHPEMKPNDFAVFDLPSCLLLGIDTKVAKKYIH